MAILQQFDVEAGSVPEYWYVLAFVGVVMVIWALFRNPPEDFTPKPPVVKTKSGPIFSNSRPPPKPVVSTVGSPELIIRSSYTFMPITSQTMTYTSGWTGR